MKGLDGHSEDVVVVVVSAPLTMTNLMQVPMYYGSPDPDQFTLAVDEIEAVEDDGGVRWCCWRQFRRRSCLSSKYMSTAL